MKILSLLFLTIFLGKGCNEEQKQDMDTAIIEYSANTRGYFLKITVKEKMISVTKDRNETKHEFEKISESDSKEIMAAVKDINLEELTNLKAPTEKRFYDGAAIGNLKITYKNRTYETSGFDHGFPPVEIERLVKKLNADGKRGIMTIKEIQDEIVEEFTMFEDWDERFQYVIDLGKGLPLIDDKFKTEDNTIKGCQSKVWLHAEQNQGQIVFTADSDAIITKGIIAILIRAFSNQKASDILQANTHFIDQIGLKEHLSPTRANGLVSMIKQIKLYALGFNANHQ